MRKITYFNISNFTVEISYIFVSRFLCKCNEPIFVNLKVSEVYVQIMIFIVPCSKCKFTLTL